MTFQLFILRQVSYCSFYIHSFSIILLRNTRKSNIKRIDSMLWEMIVQMCCDNPRAIVGSLDDLCNRQKEMEQSTHFTWIETLIHIHPTKHKQTPNWTIVFPPSHAILYEIDSGWIISPKTSWFSLVQKSAHWPTSFKLNKLPFGPHIYELWMAEAISSCRKQRKREKNWLKKIYQFEFHSDFAKEKILLLLLHRSPFPHLVPLSSRRIDNLFRLRTARTSHSNFNSMGTLSTQSMSAMTKRWRKCKLISFSVLRHSIHNHSAYTQRMWHLGFRVNDRLHFVTVTNCKWSLHQCVTDRAMPESQPVATSHGVWLPFGVFFFFLSLHCFIRSHFSSAIYCAFQFILHFVSIVGSRARVRGQWLLAFIFLSFFSRALQRSRRRRGQWTHRRVRCSQLFAPFLSILLFFVLLFCSKAKFMLFFIRIRNALSPFI